jgi:ABC-type glycerol-3-phosphate transport system substrate-binding protein
MAEWLAQMPGETFMTQDHPDFPFYPYFNEPKSKPVFEFWRELYKYSVPGLAFNPSPPAIRRAVRAGEAAYQPSFNFMSSAFPKADYPDPILFGDLPLPEAGAERTGFLVGVGDQCVLKHSELRQECMDYLRFLIADAPGVQLYKDTLFFPCTKSAMQKIIDQDLAPEGEGIFADVMLNAHTKTHPFFTKDPNAVWQAFNDMLANVITTDDPIDPILDAGQVAAEAVFA